MILEENAMELTPELIQAEIIEKGSSMYTVAEKLGIPETDFEAYCLMLCKTKPEQFDYKSFLTKDWFLQKMQNHGSLIEIANATGIHYRTLCYFKAKHIPEKRRQLSKEISRDTLWQLYVEEEKSDKEISDMYGTNIANIKRLRASYDIAASDRTPIDRKLPIELFHRMYVVSHLGLGQIASLFNTSRQTVTALKESYANAGHPLSNEIGSANNGGYYPRYLDQLLQILTKKELIEALKTKTLQEIAALHNLVAPTANRLSPMTKEWLEAELMIKSEATIAEENHITASRLSSILKELGIRKSSKISRLSEEVLRELYLNRCWSDQTIADHLGVSAATVRKERLEHKIFSDMRPNEQQRIPPELFHYLYIEEGMSLIQIGTAYGISAAKIRTLRQFYVDSGHKDLEKRGPKITYERLQYLYKLIHLDLLKI